MPIINRVTLAYKKKEEAKYHLHTDESKFMDNRDILDNIFKLFDIINGKGFSKVALSQRWHLKPGEQTNFYESFYDWAINHTYDALSNEISIINDKIGDISGVEEKEARSLRKLLLGDETEFSSEYARIHNLYNYDGQMSIHGALWRVMGTQYDMWHKLYGDLNEYRPEYYRSKAWLEKNYNVDALGTVTCVVDRLEQHEKHIDAFNELDLTGLRTDIDEVYNEIFTASLFTQPNFINRIYGLENELTRNGAKRLTHIDQLLSAILNEIGGYHVDEYRFTDSRITKLETGLVGGWDEQRIKNIEDTLNGVVLYMDNLIELNLLDELTGWKRYRDSIIPDMKNQITALNSVALNHQVDINNIKTVSLPNLTNNFISLKSQIDNLAIPDISTLEARVKNLEVWKADLEIPDISPLETRVKNLEMWQGSVNLGDIETLKADLAGIQKQISELDIPDISELENIVASIETWKAELEIPDLTETNIQLNEIENRIQILSEIDINSLQQQLVELESWAEQLKISDVSGLSSKLTGIQMEIDAIVIPDLTPLENNINAVINALNDTIFPDISELKGNLSALELQFQELEIPDIKPLEARISSVETQIQESIKKRLDEDAKQIADLKTVNNKILELLKMLIDNPAYLLPALLSQGDEAVESHKALWQWLIARGIK